MIFFKFYFSTTKTLLIALICALPCGAIAQIAIYKKPAPYHYHLQLGINHSRIVLDSVRTEAVIMPYFGANISNNLTPKTQLIFGGQVSFRAGEAIIPQSIRYRNAYFDAQILAKYQAAPDVAVLAGAQAALAYSTTTARPDSTGRTFVPTSGFKKINYETLLGIDLRLHPQAHLRLLYTLPITPNLQYTNLQAGLVINTEYLRNLLHPNQPTAKKTAAITQITQLKNSVLLVCLRTNDTLNTRIIQNFEKHYNFTPVYFFYDTAIINIVRRNWQNQLYNTKNQPATLNNATDFFIAQHTQPQADTTRTIDTYTYEKRNGKLEKMPNYYNAGITDVMGWTVFDKNFIQLQPPFPHFARTMRGKPANILSGIITLNQQLSFYYKNNL